MVAHIGNPGRKCNPDCPILIKVIKFLLKIFEQSKLHTAMTLIANSTTHLRKK